MLLSFDGIYIFFYRFFFLQESQVSVQLAPLFPHHKKLNWPAKRNESQACLKKQLNTSGLMGAGDMLFFSV